jgi:hypothetical protein
MLTFAKTTLLSGVDQLVSSQITSLGKRFVAHITHMIFLPCMDQLVDFQITSLSKSFAANITHIIPLSCMD